jgi:hypothetical protein
MRPNICSKRRHALVHDAQSACADGILISIYVISDIINQFTERDPIDVRSTPRVTRRLLPDAFMMPMEKILNSLFVRRTHVNDTLEIGCGLSG